MYRYIRSDIYYKKDGTLDIDYYNDNHGGIPTKLGKKGKDRTSGSPYLIEKDKYLNGHIVYSVYPFKGSNYVQIFKDIKQGKMDPELYDEWLEYTARYIFNEIMLKNRPDIIAVPESSSPLALDLAKHISKRSGIAYLPHAFKKNPVEDIIIQLPEDGADSDKSEGRLKIAEKVLEQIKKKGVFESKSVPKKVLKLFRNIYTNDDEYIDLLWHAKVAVVDDSISSKSTMMNIFDVCDYLYETSESYGITLFKKVGSQ